MKRFMSKKLLDDGVDVDVAHGVGGAAFAYFTSSGGGTGSAAVGTASNLSIHQIGTTVYDSTVSPSPADWWSEAFSQLNVGEGPAEIGDAVTLASTSAPLSTVVVMLNNWACEVGNGNPNGSCVTATPGSTYPATLTLNIYAPGSLVTPIATDTQTFAIPFRPSADPGHCSTGNNWSGYPNDGSQWYDAATKTCNYGQITPVTFNFSSLDVTLPPNIVYGISSPGDTANSSDPVNYLNVVLSTEPTDVTVGSDTYPGNIYMDVPVGESAAAGPGPTGAAGTAGQMSCTAAVSELAEYSTAAGADGCGAGATNNIPAVQFNESGSGMADLYPGGTPQPINFSVTNPGAIPVHVGSVHISVASDTIGDVESTPGEPDTAVTGCSASWFSFNAVPVGINGNVAPATTDYWSVNTGATIQMNDNGTNQDACEGASIGLVFTTSS